MMVRFGIAPRTAERAKAAIKSVYQSSRSVTASVPQAEDALLERLRKLVAATKHFPRVEKGRSLTADQKKNAWGVVREIAGKKNVAAVKPARFEKLVMPSAVADAVLQDLAKRGQLLKETDGNLKRQVLIKGQVSQARLIGSRDGGVARELGGIIFIWSGNPA